jgi:hypothetical protein
MYLLPLRTSSTAPPSPSAMHPLSLHRRCVVPPSSSVRSPLPLHWRHDTPFPLCKTCRLFISLHLSPHPSSSMTPTYSEAVLLNLHPRRAPSDPSTFSPPRPSMSIPRSPPPSSSVGGPRPSSTGSCVAPSRSKAGEVAIA